MPLEVHAAVSPRCVTICGIEFNIPPQLLWLHGELTGSEWLETLAQRIERLAERWDLDVGKCFPGANVSFAAPAVRADGSTVVLKVQWPHRECEHEAAALRAWAGKGAPLLIDHCDEEHALLIERCAPGTYLADDPSVDPIAILIELLPRLWVPAGEPFTTLAEESLGLAHSLIRIRTAGYYSCDTLLLDAAIEYLRELPDEQGDQVLVHQDLHGHNVIAAQREPWLVIDPKPLVGEREFAVAPIIRSAEFGSSNDDVRYRFDRLTAELDLDRERARGWMIGHSVAWGIDSAPHLLAMAQFMHQT